MSTDNIMGRNELFSAMDAGTPFKSYIKTILGKLAVDVWDNFTNQPTEIILQGNPKKKEEGCIVDVWSEKEDAFFNRVNRRHFQKGMLIPYTRPSVEEAAKTKKVEQSTDDELAEILKMKWIAFIHKIGQIDSIAVLFRLRGIAEELNKSEKVTKAIEGRITELQDAEYSPIAVTEDEEE